MSFIKTTVKRWCAKTPKYFKKLQRVCIALGAIGALIALNPLHFPLFIQALGPYLSTMGLFGAFITQLTVDHKEEKVPQ